MKASQGIFKFAALSASVLACFSAQAEWSANASVTNNYIWRGLTQTTNEPAVQGGIDYTSESGFYAGTWASNVQYAADDVFSYEHDIYFGYAGETDTFTYDIGYLYYNYDSEAEFDFGEIYGSIGFNNFTFTAYLLANTEADEGFSPSGDEQNFDFASAFYFSADYAYEIKEGLELGLHIGFQDGDFSEAFNGVENGYFDYSVSLAKDGFSFTVTTTDLEDAGPDGLDNDEVKFVVGYAVDFAL
ncbi:hypothetical protein J3L16_08495 [Alteromonas sp. 5E99-2]|uniref:TorF family putative porin n=1 Tax=Alteromonas sp. 5E99-2 TaxID=2817683 RepID=UPI001A9884B6|nr:TorF family putative porin [Alteromonas sp. 5E99-2]MBO1255721.1 hypothetical protein [Alteromonas sp. 5E99-2]